MSDEDELNNLESIYQYECDLFKKDEIESRKELENKEKYKEKIKEITDKLKIMIGKSNLI